MNDLASQLPVYEKKPNLSSKIASWWRSLGFITKIVAVLAVTAVSLAGLATRSFQATQIALISEGNVSTTPVQPPTTQPQPSSPAYPSPVACQNGVKVLNLTDTCGSMGFHYASFTCNNGSTGALGDSSNCLTVDDALTNAYNRCRCGSASPLPPPTSQPTSQPTSLPTATPTASPTLSCKVDVYRLRAGDNDSNGALYMTADRLVDPSKVSVTTTDKFVYVPTLTTSPLVTAKYQLSLTTQNVAADKEPLIVRSINGNCSIVGNKTIACKPTIYYLQNSKPFASPINSLLVEIQPGITQAHNTSTMFTYTGYDLSTNKPVQTSCTVQMFAPQTVTPSIAPQPTPITKSPVTKIYTCRVKCSLGYLTSKTRRSACLQNCQ